MRKDRRNLLLAALVAAAVVGGMGWWALSSRPPAVPDPVYDGHPISYWIDPTNSPKSSGYVMQPLPAAGSLDTNALPYLIQALKRRPGALRTAYNHLWPHLPRWLENRLPTPQYFWQDRYNACQYLGELGRRAQPAIPELVRVLREDVTMVKKGAAYALWQIASRGDQQAIEALWAATKDKDAEVRGFAAEALKFLDPEAAAQAGFK